MGLKKLLNSLAAHLPHETTVHLSDGFPFEEASQIWGRYLAYKKAGYMQPFHTRRAPYKVKLYHFDGYVIKEYSGAVEKVKKELAILDRLQHPNIVTYSFAVFERSHASIVMEWAGQDLRENRQEHPELYNEGAIRHLAYQLTSALLYCHQQGIIHRDVKPDNIGVHRSSQHLHLFDWGEAVTLDDVTSLPDKQLASSVGVAGTPLFMAPEALTYLTSPPGEARTHLRDTLTTKLDIWGLGTVLYFLLAGRDVFEDGCNLDLENIVDLATVSTGIELPEGTPASCAARDFLRRCLEADPEQRASTKELMEHPWLRGASSFEELVAAQAAAAHAAVAAPAAAAGSGSKQCSSGGKEGSHGVKQVLAVVADAGTSTDCSVDRASRSSSSSSSCCDHMASSSSSARHPLVEVDLVQRQQQHPPVKDHHQQQQQQDQGHKAAQQEQQQPQPQQNGDAQHQCTASLAQQQQQQQRKGKDAMRRASQPPRQPHQAPNSAAAAAAAAGDVQVSIRASNPQVAAAFAAATRGQPSHACWQPRPLPAGLAPVVGQALPASAAAAHRSALRHQVPTSHPLVGSAMQARQRSQQAPAAALQQQQQQQPPPLGGGVPLTAVALARLNSRDGKPFDEAVCEVRLRPSPSAASLTQLNSG